MRLKLIIMNFLYLAVSVIALVIFYTQPYFDASVTYNLTPAAMEEIVGPYISDDIDMKDVVGENGIDIKIQVKITSMMGIQCAINKNPLAYAEEKVIAPNIESISKTVEQPLTTLIDALLSNINTVRMYKLICTNITTFDPLLNPKDTLDEANVTIENFKTAITQIGENSIYPGHSTLSEITDLIAAKFDEIYTQIAANHATFAFKTTTASEKEAISNDEKDMFTTFEMYDESTEQIRSSVHGVISMIGMATKDKERSQNSNSGSNSAEPLLARGRTITEDESEELYTSLNNFVISLLNDHSKEANLSVRITGIVLLFMMASWALLGVFCLIKSLFKNPGIFLGLIFWLNLIIQVVLGLVLTLGVRFLPSFVGYIPLIGQTINEFIAPFKLSISTSATIPAIMALGVLVTGFLYSYWKRKLKEEI